MRNINDILKSLVICSDTANIWKCNACPYKDLGEPACHKASAGDAAAIISQYQFKVEQLTKERKSAVKDLTHEVAENTISFEHRPCRYCFHAIDGRSVCSEPPKPNYEKAWNRCWVCRSDQEDLDKQCATRFQWRGVCAENGGTNAKNAK
ncbi:hypothetical protein AGMMS49992_26830 [Clostridia bacterium]|nr:hypothetical protein AGMMS49992_26830 [Clostridia bacterium]